MKGYIPAIFAAVTLVSAPLASAMPGDPDQVGLGTVWMETESGWQGTWQRVGKSNKFNAVWTKGSKDPIRAELTMELKGNTIWIIRRDLTGPSANKGCQYNGKITGRTATGSYTCEWSRDNIPWKATIH